MRKSKTALVYYLLVTGLVLILGFSCKKEDNGNSLNIVVTTAAVDTITKTTARSGGKISANPGLVITFRGVCWSKDKPSISKPLNTEDSITIDGAGAGEFSSSITGLKSGETYYIRAYATYFVEADSVPKVKTSYGNVLIFSTSKENVYTTPVISRTRYSAVCGGIIEFGSTISTRGICWSLDSIPTITNTLFKTIDGTGLGSFESLLSPLEAGTTYFARAYAFNSGEPIPTYGNIIVIRTFGESQISDPDGNIYNTIKIGAQEWMVENLKTTKYNDGTEIKLVTSNVTWGDTIKAPTFCWYNNDMVKFKDNYGALYNWYTVNTGKLCPAGWHVPTDDDWTMLTDNSLDGEATAGGKLKEAGLSHWLSPNDEAVNETGFTGLPGGGRNFAGSFDDMGQFGYLWSSTPDTSNAKLAWFRYLAYEDGKLTRTSLDKRSGISVRCIRD